MRNIIVNSELSHGLERVSRPLYPAGWDRDRILKMGRDCAYAGMYSSNSWSKWRRSSASIVCIGFDRPCRRRSSRVGVDSLGRYLCGLDSLRQDGWSIVHSHDLIYPQNRWTRLPASSRCVRNPLSRAIIVSLGKRDSIVEVLVLVEDLVYVRSGQDAKTQLSKWNYYGYKTIQNPM